MVCALSWSMCCCVRIESKALTSETMGEISERPERAEEKRNKKKERERGTDLKKMEAESWPSVSMSWSSNCGTAVMT